MGGDSALEEGLLIEGCSVHGGIRGPIHDELDLRDHERFGFRVVRAGDIDRMVLDEVVAIVPGGWGTRPCTFP